MSELRSSPLAEQLQRGFHALRFEGSLESAYHRDQFRDRLSYLRINLAVLAAIAVVLIQIDRVAVPMIGRLVPDLARTGVMLPLLLLGFAVTFLPRAAVWYPRYMAVAMAVALSAIAWLGIGAWAAGEPRLFVRLVIATVAVYFVLGLPFRAAIAVNGVAVAAYLGFALVETMPGVELTHYLSMLLVANVICAAGAYNLEHARRTAWLEGQRLAEIALQDSLTRISNRRRFDDHLQVAWAHGVRERRPIALLFADIDHFKRYNDRYGHQAGDEALKAVASVFARFARRPLDLAARYGGEEFALVLFGTTLEHAQHIGAEIMAAVRELGIRHADSDVAPTMTISMGIACVVPTARRSWEGLVQLADQALYAAKDAGRNQARCLETEYEHMKTGYFRRHAAGDGESGRG